MPILNTKTKLKLFYCHNKIATLCFCINFMEIKNNAFECALLKFMINANKYLFKHNSATTGR